MKSIKYLVLVSLACLFLFQSCADRMTSLNLDNFQPIEEFAPAYEALSKPIKENTKEYDIEETIRIINSLELAQTQSDDFYSFLEYMAKQDYSMVADDVMQSKAKLLIVLQQMYKLQQANEELSDMWMLARSVASGSAELVKNTDVTDALSLTSISGIVANPLGILNITSSVGMDDAKVAAFGQYEKDMALKSSLVKEIEHLKTLYLEYLNEFAPIYHKYMQEWDRLCVNKDKAYLDVYSGRMVDGYNSASEVLKKYPLNREALLLKALSLINIGSGQTNITGDSQSAISLQSEVGSSQYNVNEYYLEAMTTLDTYIDNYPNRSAPALVLKGLLANHMGQEQQALSYFDQAAIEYPRQAAMLTDLLDSYKNRSYLNKTPEGQYLLRLYRSTMEGYGIFSPNLIKAKYYDSKGDVEKSKNEIFNHFFRRGNQGIYDCLLSDMQFCEEHLYNTFRQFLMERSYFDIDVKPETDWKFADKDDEISVSIYNRSDVDLENVRVFLCLHYTDMYKDEYDVVKVPAKNIVKHHQNETLGTVQLQYPGKVYDDITRIRAIVMTDDGICWIDNPDYKKNNAIAVRKDTDNQKRKIDDFLQSVSLNVGDIKQAINDEIGIKGGVNNEAEKTKEWFSKKKMEEIGSSISALWDKQDNKLKIELPRVLTFIEPVFSINPIQDEKAILPIENYLTGLTIRLKFDYEPQMGEQLPLYIYSEFVNLKIDIDFAGENSKVKEITTF